MPQLSPSLWFLLVFFISLGLFCFFCSLWLMKPLFISPSVMKSNKKSFNLCK